MRKSSKKRVLILSIMLLVTFLFVCRYIPYIKPVPVEAVEHLDSVLEIHMIDVGQAESILVVQGEHAMLIDTGDMFDGKTVVRYLQSVGINKLDAVIITHYHNDHSGGMHDVLSAIEVKKSCRNAWKVYFYSTRAFLVFRYANFTYSFIIGSCEENIFRITL